MLTIEELQTELQNLTNLKITQAKIGEALGTTRANISLRVKNESIATLEEIKKIVTFLNLPNPHAVLNALLNKNNTKVAEYFTEEDPGEEDTISMDYYPDIFGSCGGGSFVFSENKQVLEVPKKLITSYNGFYKYSVINAIGDSMTPYIFDRDKLVVEHWHGEQIRDNRIYIFRFGDNIFVKRLVLNLDQIIVKSDNKEYSVRYIEKKDADDFQLIGRIVGIWREEL